MFPGKENQFLRKWEGHIVPKLLKVARLENENDPDVLSAGEESDGKFSYPLDTISIYHLYWMASRLLPSSF